MQQFSIRDSLFSHAYSSSNWFKPSFFEWDFNNIHNDFVFFTDNNLLDSELPQYQTLKKYAWLIESPAVTPIAYQYIKDNAHKFDKIFTHSEYILQNTNAYLLPIGGCHLNTEDINAYHTKDRLVSMMYSTKNFAPGHALRHEVAQKLSNCIDVMGSGFTGQHVNKIESCKNYAFSVVIENCKEGYYFTEKIIDCFLTGTIPIYWGCPHIDQFFDTDGFIIFNTVDELRHIVKDPTYLIEYYSAHMDAILTNFNKAMQYKIAEDYLFTHYKNIL